LLIGNELGDIATKAIKNCGVEFQPLRREDDALLRGQGQFVHNLSLPSLLHVVFARSDHAFGLIDNVDATDAKAMPGVLAVLGVSELGQHFMPAPNPLLKVNEGLRFSLLADREVQAVGQILAVVIAVSADAAQAAAQSVRLNLREGARSEQKAQEPADSTSTVLNSSALNSTTVIDNFSHTDFACDEIATEVSFVRGVAVDPHLPKVRVTLRSPRVQAMAMEPRASMAQWHEDTQHLTFWMGTQTPSRARTDLANVLGLAEQQVRVITPDVGGAFGAKASIYPEDLLLALSARYLKANLSWRSSRSEEFISAMHGRGSVVKGELSFSKEGRFYGLKADLHFSLGHWMPFSAVVPLRNAARILPGPYQVEGLEVQGRASLSHAAAVNIYRGAGRPEAALLMETLVEQAGRALRIDPIELRRRNLIPVQAMPYQTLSGETFDSGDYLQALNRACERFGYDQEREQQKRRRGAGELVGIGTSIYVEPCGQGWESASVTLHADGRVTLASGSPAQGQGHHTSFARIAAQALSCLEASVEVVYGDTGLTPPGLGALASRSTAIAGSAIVKVCLEALARREQGQPLPITVEDRFESQEAWGYGCLMARLSIDRETGVSKIEKVVWIDDAGTIIHPTLAKGQLLGGFAQGMGQAMMERMVYDPTGQLLTGSLMDYAVPRAADMPEVIIESLFHPATTNLLGAKGVGEAGCIGVPAVLMNAARDALAGFGELELEFPLSSEQLWRAQKH
jgi:aerobic carbon-monoxide dehydrogenase large subunit